MKKLTTAVVLATGLLISASACAAPTKLTTPQTCDRIKDVVSTATGNIGKIGLNRLANQIRPIEAVASDDLKPSLRVILDYTDESAKDNPDSGKLNALKTDYEQAGSTYSKFCS